MKCANDKTNKDVNHEECDDDDVDEVEYGNIWTVVVLWTNVWGVGVNRNIQNSAKKRERQYHYMNIMNNDII